MQKYWNEKDTIRFKFIKILRNEFDNYKQSDLIDEFNEVIELYNKWQIKEFDKNIFIELIGTIIKLTQLFPKSLEYTTFIHNEECRLLKFIVNNSLELYYQYYNKFSTKNDIKEIEILHYKLGLYPEFVELCKHYNIVILEK